MMRPKTRLPFLSPSKRVLFCLVAGLLLLGQSHSKSYIYDYETAMIGTVRSNSERLNTLLTLLGRLDEYGATDRLRFEELTREGLWLSWMIVDALRKDSTQEKTAVSVSAYVEAAYRAVNCDDGTAARVNISRAVKLMPQLDYVLHTMAVPIAQPSPKRPPRPPVGK
jgi:hypothetical protein